MEKQTKKIHNKVSYLTKSAMFAAIATLLMYIEFPLPFMPPFLKVDLSGVAILIAAFLFGPWYAVGITAVKDIIHLFSSQTGGVGELADFLVLGAFAVFAGIIYNRSKDKKHALLGATVGMLVATVVAAFANRYLLIPFYAQVMPIEAILSVCGEINPLIGSIDTYILFGAVPFNLIKGVILTTITFLLYKRLSKILHKI